MRVLWLIPLVLSTNISSKVLLNSKTLFVFGFKNCTINLKKEKISPFILFNDIKRMIGVMKKNDDGFLNKWGLQSIFFLNVFLVFSQKWDLYLCLQFAVLMEGAIAWAFRPGFSS